MDRISALRNVEDALAAFEAGEATLQSVEADVRGILRTYATNFDGEQAPFEATGGNVDGVVVLAHSQQGARDRVVALVDDPGQFQMDPLS
jgi:anti-sigma factor ChrR (cupin superfamily)